MKPWMVIQETGHVYGDLTVVRQDTAKHNSHEAHWVCKCKCGNECVVRGASLRIGKTQSCGCLQRARIGAVNRTHGHRRSVKHGYDSWWQMLQRCYNPQNKDFFRYGERGITVCASWHTFEGFCADMYPRPTGLTLDRYPDRDGNYEPGNVRWATPKQQANNRRPRRRHVGEQEAA